jgi:hypothetical protein
VYLNIDFLSMLDVQDVERSVTSINHLQRARIRRVVVAEEGPVVDREAIAPQVKLAVGARLRCLLAGVGVGDVSRGSVVAAECIAAAGEARGRLLIVAAWSRSVSLALVSTMLSLGPDLYSLPRPLQDVVDVVPRVCLVGVLHSEPRLLSSSEEVLVLVVLVVLIGVIVVVGMSVSAAT